MSKVTGNQVAIVRDLEFFWANVYTAHSPFGTEQWDLQIRTEDKDKVKELEALGIKMKTHEDGFFFGNIKRKTTNAKGEPNSAPVVLNAGKEQMTDNIGNGSRGNIKVFSYEYKVAGKSGRSAMLSAIQVTDLVEYKAAGGVDFDVEGEEPAF